VSTQNPPNIVDGSAVTPDTAPVLETYALPIHLDQVWETDGVLQRDVEVARWLVWLGRAILRVSGWKLYGQLPAVPKLVLVAAFHTTNWDGFWMLVAAYSLGVRPRWMVKIEWVRGRLGWLVNIFGGLGIDRSHSRDAVQQAVDLIHDEKSIVMVISPEGTRRKTDHWKTGFYWIAYNANVPIVCSFLDYKYKRIGIGPVVIPSGDIDADMETMWAFYRNINAKHPEKVSEMRLRPSQHRASTASASSTASSASKETPA
jgi:hypothetical protein